MSGADRTVDVLDTPEAGGLVVRGGVLRAAGFAVGTLLSLGAIVLLTRHLGVVEFGRFQVVVSLVAVVGVVTDLGMATVGIREYAQKQGAERDRLMRVILGMRLSFTALGVAVAAGFALVAGYRDDMVVGVLVMGVGLVVLVVQTTLQIPLNAGLRLGAVSALDVARQAMQAALTALLVFAGAALLPFFTVTVPVHLALVAGTAAFVGRTISLRPSFSVREWGPLARPVLVYSLAVAVGIVYVYTAQILMSLVATERETGLFSAGFRVFVIMAAVPSLLATAAFPLLSRAALDDQERLARIVRGLFAGTLLVGGAVAVTCVAGADLIIAVIAGPGYEPAAAVLRVQGVALLLTFVIATWGFTLLAQHRHHAMVYANLASLITSSVTVLVLAAGFGELGGALGTLLGEMVLAAGYLWALTRGRRDLRPDLRQAARVALALAAAGGVALLPLPAAAVVVLALATYGAVALLVGAVPEDLIAQLPARLRGWLRRP